MLPVVVNGDWLPDPKQPQKHTVMPRRSKPWEKIAGWSDCAWLTGGCLSFTLPAWGLILPQQPCRFPCSRPLTGSRKQPGLSVSCPGSPALGLMTPTALCWQLRNKQPFWLSGKCFSWFADLLFCHFHGTWAVFLISSLNSSFPAPWILLISSTSAFGIAPVGGGAVTEEMRSGRLTHRLHILHHGDCGKLLWLTGQLPVCQQHTGILQCHCGKSDSFSLKRLGHPGSQNC